MDAVMVNMVLLRSTLGVPEINPVDGLNWKVLSKLGEIMYDVGVPPLDIGEMVDEIVTPLVKTSSSGL